MPRSAVRTVLGSLTRSTVLAGAIVLALTGCGTSTTAGTPSMPGAAIGAGSDLGTDLPTDPGTDLGTDLPGAGSGGASDQVPTAELDMQIRLANLWLPAGATGGQAIDVWVGSPEYGGTKLMTVDYGTASEFVAMRIPDPQGQGQVDKNTSWTISYYPAGKTATDDMLMQAGGTSSPGQKLTLLAGPVDADSTGLTLQQFADDAGSDPQEGNWSGPSIAVPTDGTAAVMINAMALQYTGTDGDMPGYIASAADGCLDYIDPLTGELHDDPYTDNLVGGTQGLTYFLQPGGDLRLHLTDPDAQTPVRDECAAAPTLDAGDTGLAANGRAFGFMYGTDPAAPKMLLLPVG
ncbi:hypothetical protein GIS00_16810 [Nakamurella sp. YIM 132087]|uniref:Uncharacterized protein n=1 Tax=Nakamurella alba TaxID=2665158 RepID=A0A7K1FN76_9ACTN|nr:hypothetical protein [Nakamurella alba]MTD15596.1 hypothetical protein [Nakamurella alba]